MPTADTTCSPGDRWPQVWTLLRTTGAVAVADGAAPDGPDALTGTAARAALLADAVVTHADAVVGESPASRDATAALGWAFTCARTLANDAPDLAARLLATTGATVDAWRRDHHAPHHPTPGPDPCTLVWSLPSTRHDDRQLPPVWELSVYGFRTVALLVVAQVPTHLGLDDPRFCRPGVPLPPTLTDAGLTVASALTVAHQTPLADALATADRLGR